MESIMNFNVRTMRYWLAILLLFGAASYAADVRELGWEDLMPAREEFAPSPNTSNPIDGEWEDDIDDPFMSPVYPTGVVEELDGITAKIPGFVVPLELADDGKIKEFLLVPYFGACIHYPPPPPNQLVYVILEDPIEIADPWEPVWATGELKTEFRGSEIGSAGYTMNADSIDEYVY